MENKWDETMGNFRACGRNVDSTVGYANVFQAVTICSYLFIVMNGAWKCSYMCESQVIFSDFIPHYLNHKFKDLKPFKTIKLFNFLLGTAVNKFRMLV